MSEASDLKQAAEAFDGWLEAEDDRKDPDSIEGGYSVGSDADEDLKHHREGTDLDGLPVDEDGTPIHKSTQESADEIEELLLDKEEEAREELGEDEEVEVTEEEAERGYLRDRDYRQKTMALAVLRKALHEMRDGLEPEAREKFDELSARFSENHDLALGEPEDVAQMRQEISAAHKQAKPALEQIDHIGSALLSVTQALPAPVQQQVMQAVQMAQGDLSRMSDEAMAREDAAFSEKLRLDNEAASLAAKERIVQGAMEHYRYTPDELAGVTDHRLLLMASDAMKYREMQANRGKSDDVLRSTRKKSKTLEPGNQNVRQPSGKAKQQKQLDSAKKKLRQSGKVRDAAAAMFQILGDDI